MYQQHNTKVKLKQKFNGSVERVQRSSLQITYNQRSNTNSVYKSNEEKDSTKGTLKQKKQNKTKNLAAYIWRHQQTSPKGFLNKTKKIHNFRHEKIPN